MLSLRIIDMPRPKIEWFGEGEGEGEFDPLSFYKSIRSYY